MKKFIIVLSILFIALSASARHGEYGIKLGLSFGAPLGPLVSGSKGAPGLYPSASGYYEYKFTPKWGLLAEINYQGMNASFETPYADFLGDGVLIRKDPQTGEEIREEIKDFYIYYAYVKNGRMKNGYLSMPISASYHTKMGLNFDMRFSNDLTSYFKKSFDAAPGVYRLMTVQTTVGYRIGGGKELK